MTPSLRIFLASAAALLAGGCYYQDCPVQDARAYRGQGYVEVQAPPPPIQGRVEVRPAKPEAAAAWVPGHWDWQGRWVWVDGHWQTPRPGHVWTPPVARRTPQGPVRYYPGHWRPRDQAPPPVYREPGEVRVSVRPARPADGVRVRTPEERGGVVVRPGGTVRRPGRVETRRPDVRVDRPHGTVRGDAGGTVEVRPGTRPATEVRPGGEVRGPEPGTVRPRPGTVRGPGAETVQPPPRSHGDVRGRAPETVRPREGGAIRGPSAETVPLGCQLTTSRAPRGGYVTIRGTGFGSSPVVRVGGRIAPVVSTEREQIRFQVPRDSRGGTVAVSAGDASATCGALTIVGR